MNYELIINSTPNEVVIALLSDKRLVELHREKNNSRFSVGDIYLGKAKKVMTGLNAAFIDVGYEKDAFLHYLDLGHQAKSFIKYVELIQSGKQNVGNLMYFKNESDIKKEGKINDIIKSGQNILVQVAKEPISAKGPRVTTEISLAGRYLVLIPFSDKISVSSKIRNNDEKHRLKDLMHSIKPKNFGVIVRTVAENKSVAELEGDLNDLIKRWEDCHQMLKTSQPPIRVLGEVDRSNAILRDFLNASFNAIHVNNQETYDDLKTYLQNIAPDRLDILKLYTGKPPIFDAFGVEKQIKSLFGKTVHMKSGAYLVIEHTEALHVFDVNSGNRAKSDHTQEQNALEVNIEAAKEVARQLKLRDMGGIIVVDFIDLHGPENRKLLFDTLKEEMRSDRAKHNILPPSKFGLIQITRQRLRPEVNVEVLETCPSCGGTGKVQPTLIFVDQLENTLRYIIKDQNQSNITLQVHPFIEAYINQGGWFKTLKWKWYKEFKQKVKVEPMTAFGILEYKFFNKNGEEIVL
ncbi:MAG: Rne/Rng family ribonuclease [Sphingobacteriaceae bacterium]|nr:Rne/Rng family ribonuclease [Sphingobacteriaceae bacterium]